MMDLSVEGDEKMDKMPKVKTFDEWLIEYHPNWQNEEGEGCPECNGSGEYTCGECGTEVECKECDGRGYFPVKDQYKIEYNNLKKDDLKKFENWKKIV
jgi:DnaJ-class molecular chaperone